MTDDRGGAGMGKPEEEPWLAYVEDAPRRPPVEGIGVAWRSFWSAYLLPWLAIGLSLTPLLTSGCTADDVDCDASIWLVTTMYYVVYTAAPMLLGWVPGVLLTKLLVGRTSLGPKESGVICGLGMYVVAILAVIYLLDGGALFGLS